MLKEVMTSFDVAATVHEIHEQANSTHVAKIYQIGTQTILLKLRKPNQPRLQLLIEAGKQLHLTSYVHETPTTPSAFCMSLRKYLNNGVIKTVRQQKFERIVVTEIATRQGDYQLVTELFGGGNIILVDPEGKILHAMTYKRMRDRNIIRGEIFQHPPARGKNPLKLSLGELMQIRTLEDMEIVRALIKFMSISGTYAEEILLRTGINKKTTCNSLTEQQLESIFNQLQTLLSAISSGNMKPCIVSNEKGVWIDVTPVPLKKHEGFERKYYERFNSALDDYYAKQTNVEKLDVATGDVKNEVARQQRILKSQEKALETLKEPITKNKAIGDQIYLHFGDLQALLQKIMEYKNSGKSWKAITQTLEEGKQAKRLPEIYYKSLEPANQILHLSLDKTVFSLNLRQSLQANADNYYSRSKKAEKKLRGAEKQLQETIAKIKKAEKKVTLAKTTQEPLAKRRKKEWFEKFRWFHSSDGFLVIGGRDATTNEIIIKKHMEPHDIVFHAEIVGAPFVLIKTEGKTVPEQTINEAAQLAASYSKAWREMLTSINVYWINPSQVSKTPPSGQFLTKGSFMIRGTKNFVRNVPLRVAVGIKIDKEEIMVVGGPVEAIANQTKVFMEIVPGEKKSSQLAKKVRHSLSKNVPETLTKTVTGIPLEEFQRVIPLGRGKIALNRR